MWAQHLIVQSLFYCVSTRGNVTLPQTGSTRENELWRMPIKTVRVTSSYFPLHLPLSNLRTVQLWTSPCCFSYFKNTELLKCHLFFQLGIRWLDFADLCISWQNQLKSMNTDWFLHHLVKLESTVLLLQKRSNWSLVKHYQKQYCWRKFLQLFWHIMDSPSGSIISRFEIPTVKKCVQDLTLLFHCEDISTPS